jgi:hypothetical protein
MKMKEKSDSDQQGTNQEIEASLASILAKKLKWITRDYKMHMSKWEYQI